MIGPNLQPLNQGLPPLGRPTPPAAEAAGATSGSIATPSWGSSDPSSVPLPPPPSRASLGSSGDHITQLKAQIDHLDAKIAAPRAYMAQNGQLDETRIAEVNDLLKQRKALVNELLATGFDDPFGFYYEDLQASADPSALMKSEAEQMAGIQAKLNAAGPAGSRDEVTAKKLSTLSKLNDWFDKNIVKSRPIMYLSALITSGIKALGKAGDVIVGAFARASLFIAGARLAKATLTLPAEVIRVLNNQLDQIKEAKGDLESEVKSYTNENDTHPLAQLDADMSIYLASPSQDEISRIEGRTGVDDNEEAQSIKDDLDKFTEKLKAMCSKEGIDMASIDDNLLLKFVDEKIKSKE
jgi:hypothetical protein